MSNIDLFRVVGNDFFNPLTGKYKSVFIDCLEIIYESYRTELSYGVDRDILVSLLTNYFEQNSSVDIQFEEEQDVLRDSRSKASEFLRKLKGYGWVEYEFDNNGRAKIVMPGYAVSVMQTFISVSNKSEMEYQSEVSSVFSLLTNKKLLDRPYPQVIKPAYDRTVALFTELKKLNTEIRKYIDEMTDGRNAEEIMEHFFSYNEMIGSAAYHRMQTSDNVSRFRNTIVSSLKDILNDKDVMEKAVIGYQNIENENDKDEARNGVIGMITNVINYFDSYDEIEKEIRRKHAKYLRSAASRAKMAFLNSNDIDGKLTAILRILAAALDREEEYGLYDDVPDDICMIFNMFPQAFVSGESLKTVGISKKIGDVDEIFSVPLMSEEEIKHRRDILKTKNEYRFSRKNINAFVMSLLKDQSEICGSDIEVKTKRDMIRLIFICFYGRDKRSDFIVIPKDNIINGRGFTFRDFTLKRRVKQNGSRK